MVCKYCGHEENSLEELTYKKMIAEEYGTLSLMGVNIQSEEELKQNIYKLLYLIIPKVETGISSYLIVEKKGE